MPNPKMQEYASVFDNLPYKALEIIRQRLKLPRNQFLDEPYATLMRHKFNAVDAIVVLSNSPLPEARTAIEALFGRPVTICPPCLTGNRWPPPVHHEPSPKAIALRDNPRLPATHSYQRYALLRPPGITVHKYLSRVGEERGKRDLREWVREGSVRIS